MSEMVKPYKIYSREHNCWWGPNRSGYRWHMKDAGLYTLEEAQQICGIDGIHGHRRGMLDPGDEGPSEFYVLDLAYFAGQRTADARVRGAAEKGADALEHAMGFLSCVSGSEDWCGCGDCLEEWTIHLREFGDAAKAIRSAICGEKA